MPISEVVLSWNIMDETIRPRVEVEDDSIIVTLPETTFRAIYRKPDRSPGWSCSLFKATKVPAFLGLIF